VLLRVGGALLALAVPTTAAAATHAPAFKRDTTPLPKGFGAGSGAQHSAGGGSSFLRVILGLLVVVALVYAIAWLLKRSKRAGQPTALGNVSVVATTPLAQNRAVHLLRVGEELVLVGSAENGVSRLRVYTPDEARTLTAQLEGTEPLYAATTPSSPTARRSFLDELRRRTAR
jgi:flagellar protein FliO/FliZ